MTLSITEVSTAARSEHSRHGTRRHLPLVPWRSCRLTVPGSLCITALRLAGQFALVPTASDLTERMATRSGANGRSAVPWICTLLGVREWGCDRVIVPPCEGIPGCRLRPAPLRRAAGPYPPAQLGRWR
jgi:hypothetical protein